MATRYDESFGIVPLYRVGDKWKVFLIKHKHARYWGFPKGHAENKETPQEAASRELLEETNLSIIRFLREEAFVERYTFMAEGDRVLKTVSYFMAEVSGEVSLQKNEVSRGVWLLLDEAFKKLTHQEGKTILSQVEKFLSS